jgi:hypothetical protein
MASNKHSFGNSIGHSGSNGTTGNSMGLNRCDMGKPVPKIAWGNGKAKPEFGASKPGPTFGPLKK